MPARACPSSCSEVAIPGFDGALSLHRGRGRAGRAGADGRARDPSLGRHASSSPTRPTASSSTSIPTRGSASPRSIAAAREVRARLKRLGLESFVKTTGGKGLHVVVPIEPTADWREVKSFARGVSAEMAADAPEQISDQDRRRPSGRAASSSTICATTRPRPRSAPIRPAPAPARRWRLPLRWDEASARARSERFHDGRRAAADHRRRSLGGDRQARASAAALVPLAQRGFMMRRIPAPAPAGDRAW